jgi:hypothetical protein
MGLGILAYCGVSTATAQVMPLTSALTGVSLGAIVGAL